MIQKKSFKQALKRALATGQFNYVAQEADVFPLELCRPDSWDLEGQNWWEAYPLSKLDLSTNRISSIPDEITALKDLLSVRMRNNVVENTGVGLFLLPLVKVIDLSSNKIAKLPSQANRASKLTVLDLSVNLLTNLPDLTQLCALQELNLNGNKLSVFPRLGRGLRKLDLSENKLQRVSREDLQHLRQLQLLQLRKNLIAQLDTEGLRDKPRLTLIQLRENRLTQLMDLPQMQKLDSINLGFNRLRSLSSLEGLPALTALMLNDNKLAKLPESILKVSKLKTLDISNNDLSDLPSELGLLGQLVRLQLEGNPLKCIRKTVRDSGTAGVKKYLRERLDEKVLAKYQKTSAPSAEDSWHTLLRQFTSGKELALREQGLKEFHPLICEQTHLLSVNLEGNKIQRIPDDVCKLQNLVSLNCSRNCITSVCAGLSSLTKLKTLNLSGNKLAELELNPFPRLEQANLARNQFQKLPPFLLASKQLKTLTLAYNRIAVPPDLKCLVQLCSIDLSNNKLQEASFLCNAPQIIHVNLENNQIAELNTKVGFLPNLSSLNLQGNRIKLRRSLLEGSFVGLMQYLREMHQGPIPQFYVKRAEKKVQQKKEEPRAKPQPKVQHKPIREQKKTSGLSDKEARLDQVQRQILQIQAELQNSLQMNQLAKRDKKKQKQRLIVLRNQIMKE